MAEFKERFGHLTNAPCDWELLSGASLQESRDADAVYNFKQLPNVACEWDSISRGSSEVSSHGNTDDDKQHLLNSPSEKNSISYPADTSESVLKLSGESLQESRDADAVSDFKHLTNAACEWDSISRDSSEVSSHGNTDDNKQHLLNSLSEKNSYPADTSESVLKLSGESLQESVDADAVNDFKHLPNATCEWDSISRDSSEVSSHGNTDHDLEHVANATCEWDAVSRSSTEVSSHSNKDDDLEHLLHSASERNSVFDLIRDEISQNVLRLSQTCGDIYQTCDEISQICDKSLRDEVSQICESSRQSHDADAVDDFKHLPNATSDWDSVSRYSFEVSSHSYKDDDLEHLLHLPSERNSVCDLIRDEISQNVSGLSQTCDDICQTCDEISQICDKSLRDEVSQICESLRQSHDADAVDDFKHLPNETCDWDSVSRNSSEISSRGNTEHDFEHLPNATCEWDAVSRNSSEGSRHGNTDDDLEHVPSATCEWDASSRGSSELSNHCVIDDEHLLNSTHSSGGNTIDTDDLALVLSPLVALVRAVVSPGASLQESPAPNSHRERNSFFCNSSHSSFDGSAVDVFELSHALLRNLPHDTSGDNAADGFEHLPSAGCEWSSFSGGSSRDGNAGRKSIRIPCGSCEWMSLSRDESRDSSSSYAADDVGLSPNALCEWKLFSSCSSDSLSNDGHGFEHLSHTSHENYTLSNEAIAVYDQDWVCVARRHLRLKAIVVGIIVDDTMEDVEVILTLVRSLEQLGFKVVSLMVESANAKFFQSHGVLTASAPTPAQLLQAVLPSIVLCTHRNIRHARQYEHAFGSPAILLNSADAPVIDRSRPLRPSLCVRNQEDAIHSADCLKDFVLKDFKNFAAGNWRAAELARNSLGQHPGGGSESASQQNARLSKIRRNLEYDMRIGDVGSIKAQLRKTGQDLPQLLGMRDEKGNTLLHFFASAVSPDHYFAEDLVCLLLDGPIQLDVRNKSGDTALQLAARSAIQAMRSKRIGSDSERPVVSSQEIPNRLRLAVVWNLLLSRAEPDCMEGDSGETPLMEAARAGDFSLCRMLLEFGADGELINSQGVSAANLATEPRIVSLFHQRGPPKVSSEIEQLWLLEANKVAVTFQPGRVGIAHAPGEVVVGQVLEGEQAHYKGVKVGWKIIAVGTESPLALSSESCKTKGDRIWQNLRAAKHGHAPYQATFEKAVARLPLRMRRRDALRKMQLLWN